MKLEIKLYYLQLYFSLSELNDDIVFNEYNRLLIYKRR